ncbi:MAG: hypothetical protein JJD93_17875 [Ilumatobacteraceae bacterium]|nr:hypothetical protein [Ilumatobacteraceae bacterium]
MTDLADKLNIPTQEAPSKGARPVLMLAAGLFGGLTLGIMARAWMRLISDDPQFTWNGTIFIVGGFTVFGFTQSVVAVARRRPRRRWTLTIVRVFGTIGMLPLFVGAGALMLPTVVAGGLAKARIGWNNIARWIGLAVATLPVVIVGSQLVGKFGWSLHAAAGFAGMVALYSTIVSATRFTFTAQADGWRLRRWVTITLFVLLGLLLLQFIAGFILR